MLGLLKPTDPSWVEAAAADLPALIADHAHCELKAAQSALSLAGRFAGQEPELLAPLVDLAKEETEHFRQVQDHARARGIRVGPPEPDPYVLSLRKAAADGRAPRLLDRLLIGALIEARSCERFSLLADRLPDASLRAFYRDLMGSEARHHRTFTRLAAALYGENETRLRLAALAEREAEIVTALPATPTVHG